MPETITIRLDTQAQTQGIKAITDGLRGVQSAAASVDGFLKRLAGSVLGMAAGVVGVNAVGNALKSAAEQGIAFNRTLEDAQLGIAAILRQFDPQRFKTLPDAMGAAGQAIDQLKAKAVSSPASFSQLVATFQAITGAATGAGVALNDQVELVVLMSQALAGLGIRSEQLVQESRALLTGNIDQNAQAARILGITKGDIDRAREQGKVFEFLQGKLAAFSEAGAQGSRNFSTAVSNLGDVVEQKLGAIMVPLFESLKLAALSLTEAIQTSNAEEALSGMARAAARGVDAFAWLARTAVRNLELIVDAVEALTVALTVLAARAALALGANLLPRLTGMASWFGVVNAGVTAASTTAGGMAGFIAAFKSATGAFAVFASAIAGWKAGRFLGEIDLLGKGLGEFGVTLNQVVELNILRAMRAWEAFKVSLGKGNPLKVQAIDVSIQELLVPPAQHTAPAAPGAANIPAPVRKAEPVESIEHQRMLIEENALRIQLVEKESSISAAQRTEELRAIYEERTRLVSDLQTEIAKGVQDRFVTTDDGAVRFTKDYSEAAKELNQLLREQAEIKGQLAQLERETSTQRITEIDREIEVEQLRMRTLQTKGATLPGGGTVGTLVEEKEQIKEALANMKQLVEAREQVRQTLADSDDGQALQMASEMELANAKARLDIEAQIQQLKRDTNDFTFFERMEDGLIALGEQFNNIGASIADVLVNGIGSAIRTISDGIWQVIDGTATWGDLFRNVGREIISGLIRIGIQELLLDNLKRGIMTAWAAFKGIFLAKDVAASNAAEAAKTPALAGNALLSSISSWGIAVAVGVAALAAVMASVGAFEKGGVIAGGEQLIRVNESGQESVLNARATSMLGEDMINRLNAGAVGALDLEQRIAGNMAAPADPIYQQGWGLEQAIAASAQAQQAAPAGGESQPRMQTLILVDSRQGLIDALASAEGETRVIQIVRDNKTQIGIS